MYICDVITKALTPLFVLLCFLLQNVMKSSRCVNVLFEEAMELMSRHYACNNRLKRNCFDPYLVTYAGKKIIC